jgi:acyl-CoA thioester hydrolase
MSENEMIEYECELRVRYADTDAMGIVYYSKYLEYFEVARTEMLRACGLPYAELESMGFYLPVMDASIKYYRGARYDDLLRIRVLMPSNPSPRLSINYRVMTAISKDLLAEGTTTLAFVDAKTGKPTRPPERYRDALREWKNKTLKA